MKLDAINMEIADFALEMIIACGEDGGIIYANKKARTELGYGETAEGHNIYSIFPAFLDESGMPKKMKELATGLPKDIIAYRLNKTLFHCRTVVFESTSDVYVVLGLNVSEEEYLRREISNAGEEVQEADKVKTEFVANVTHELRTPVNGILG
ncbi:MAG: hypothetical protein J6U15_00615, partial [Lachnospiraceae bacterium]|nr:hypothetical protein [Lachnospiraceae bacterium]